MTIFFRRRQSRAPLHFFHMSVFGFTLIEWLALIFVVLAMTVER